MKKTILFILVAFFSISCNVKNEKTSEELLSDEKSAYREALKTNANFELGDSSALLSIKLLSTEREYKDEIKKLVADKKLRYLNRTLIYDMGEIHTAPAYCEVIPRFHNDKLYGLTLNLEFYNSNAGIILGELARTSALKDMMQNAYGGKGYDHYYIYDSEYSDLTVSWIKNGKQILVENGSIYYIALKEQESIKDESNLKTLDVIKGL